MLGIKAAPRRRSSLPDAFGAAPPPSPDHAAGRPKNSAAAVHIGAPLLSSLALITLAGGTFWYSATKGVLVGQIASAGMLPFALHGLLRGGVIKSVMLAVTLLIIAVGTYQPAFADSLVVAMTGKSSPAANMFAAAIIFGLVFLVARLGAGCVRRRVVMKRRWFLSLDRLAGTTIGAAEGALFVMVACWTALALRPFGENLMHAPRAEDESFGRHVGRAIVRLSDEVSPGALGEFCRSTNPLNGIPALSEAAAELNATGSIDVNRLDPQTRAMLNEVLRRLPAKAAGGAPSPSPSLPSQRQYPTLQFGS
jgi:hypothetical protein